MMEGWDIGMLGLEDWRKKKGTGEFSNFQTTRNQ